ncbi:RimJ/RimL family protein N-acetyltransferase [Actinomadura coerulea]|uniref:RimJ/RimL family protein N-acetyltransferase n=1 Tax=Actinomadura coerulea TaxID=46159 RepID=A0A7X0FX16_9ACTN|nr:GNAT family protein [Actinomadura coerulea]MBB6395289.1 RimJ/RimL family protein N-acetyltransferase [Actinomadura coerulea]GGQ35133.1 N-acetyltransferase [Actinomadura coerulea]
MSEVLRTVRLDLHPVSMRDHGALLTHWTGPLVRRHLFDDRVVTPVQVSEIIEASERDFATEGYGLWALRPVPASPGGGAAAPGGPLAGVAGLSHHEGPLGHGVDVEILYSLEPDHWGRGLAAEASRAVLDYAFGVVGVHRITAEIDTANPASSQIALQLGMRRWREGPAGPDGAAYYAAERSRWIGSRRVPDVVP